MPARTASKSAVRAMTPRRERIKEGVPRTCHHLKMMQRLLVSHVKSICIVEGQLVGGLLSDWGKETNVH